MVSGPTSLSSSPMMHYRPDPGEPAVRLSATPNQTAFLVVAQEERNEARLRTRALQNGDDILYTQKSFSLGVSGSGVVYNAGLTTVVSRPHPQDHSSSDKLNSANVGPGVNSASNPNRAENRAERQHIESTPNPANEDAQIDHNLTRANLEKSQVAQNGNPLESLGYNPPADMPAPPENLSTAGFLNVWFGFDRENRAVQPA